MADAVREEQPYGARLDERLRVAAQDAARRQTLGDHQRGGQVHVAPLDTGPAPFDRRLLGVVNDGMQLLLSRLEPAAHRVSAGYVARVPEVLRTRVDQHQLPGLEAAGARSEVQH